MCHTCGNVAGDCTCMPLKNTFTQPSIPSLFFYHPDENGVASKAIYTFKRKKYVDLCEFFAEELSVKISELLSLLEISVEDCIFTYVPRTDKALRKHGFDQGELLANSLCKKLGGNCALPLLIRKRGKEQKKLSHAERKKNAAKSILANTKTLPFGKKTTSLSDLLSDKTVILVDDVVTTGASLGRGISELKRVGAKTVLVATIARCELKKKTEKTGN